MRKSEALLTIALLGSAATSLWLWSELRSERARLAELTARPTTADSTLADTTSVTNSASDAEKHAASDGDPPAASSSRSRDEASVTYDPNEQERRLTRNPAYREVWQRKRRLELQTGLRDMQSVLGISREKSDEVITYLVDSELRGLEKPWPNPTNDEELRQRRIDIEASKRKREAELTAILGAQTATRFQEFSDSMPSRYQAYELRTALGNGAEALRDDQFEPLISAMYAEQQFSRQVYDDFRRTQGTKESTPRQQAAQRAKYEELVIDTERRTLVAASGVLSSAQLAALEKMMQSKREVRAAQENLWRMQAELSSRDAVAKTDR